jgi:DNA ligase N terminus
MDENDDVNDEEEPVLDEILSDDGDQNLSPSDDDPVAEGETPAAPKPEPSEDRASSTKFHTICTAMEKVWEAGVKHKKWSDLQKMWTILPPKYLEWLRVPMEGSDRPESIFPIFRLLMPDKDGSRQFQMAESTLGMLYGSALGLSNQSHKFKMLLHFTDRDVVRRKEDGQGDFSVVVQRVIETTKLDRASGYTIGDINKALDALSSLPAKVRSARSNHDWRSSDKNSPKKKKKPTLKEFRIQWLRRLNEGTPVCPGLSALEHKWLVRILLKKLQFGVVRVARAFGCDLSCISLFSLTMCLLVGFSGI